MSNTTLVDLSESAAPAVLSDATEASDSSSDSEHFPLKQLVALLTGLSGTFFLICG